MPLSALAPLGAVRLSPAVSRVLGASTPPPLFSQGNRSFQRTDGMSQQRKSPSFLDDLLRKKGVAAIMI